MSPTDCACSFSSARPSSRSTSPSRGAETSSSSPSSASGRRAFRRELTAEEHADLRAVYDNTETAYLGATYTHWAGYGWRARGLRNLFAVVLNSPEFLYRVEVGDDAGALTAFELATRLSFHFWNTVPDAERTRPTAPVGSHRGGRRPTRRAAAPWRGRVALHRCVSRTCHRP